MRKSERHLESTGQQKLKPWAVPDCLTVSSDSPTEAFRSLVVGFVSPPTQVEEVKKVLYHLLDTTSLQTGPSAGRGYLHLNFLWQKERKILVTWTKGGC